MTTQRSPGLFRRLAHGSLVKTDPGRPCSGDLLAWIANPRRKLLVVRYFVRLRTKAVAPHPGVDAGDGIYCGHQHGQKTNIRPILFHRYLLCCSGRSRFQLRLPFYPALIQ